MVLISLNQNFDDPHGRFDISHHVSHIASPVRITKDTTIVVGTFFLGRGPHGVTTWTVAVGNSANVLCVSWRIDEKREISDRSTSY
eukprot:scaffold597_cov176-Amphora_coffeaeformis.AAC.21